MDNKSIKKLIKFVLKEISQKDINARLPQRHSFDNQWNPKFGMMTLDNLKALRDKAIRTIKTVKPENDIYGIRKRATKEFVIYQNEIKRRLNIINRPVSEDLGYSQNNVIDLRGDTCVRDVLNDPEMIDNLHEQYRFDDFKWLGRMDGFGVPTDVYYGSILLGVIVSDEDGYMISIVKGPTMEVSYKQSPKNKFKSKQQAADVLHRIWKSLRNNEETQKQFE